MQVDAKTKVEVSRGKSYSEQMFSILFLGTNEMIQMKRKPTVDYIEHLQFG